MLPASGQPWNRTRPLTAYQTVPVNQLGRCPRSGRWRCRAPRPGDRHELSKPVAAPAAHLPLITARRAADSNRNAYTPVRFRGGACIPGRFTLHPGLYTLRPPECVDLIPGVLGGSRTRSRRLLKPPSLPRLEYEHVEPPPGADPGRPPYESGTAAVRGGVAASRGFEPRFPEPESGVLPVGRKGIECGRRDSNAQTARSELARSPNCRHFRVRRPGIEPGFPRLRAECFTDIARGACRAVGAGGGRSRPHHLPGSPSTRRATDRRIARKLPGPAHDHANVAAVSVPMAGLSGFA